MDIEKVENRVITIRNTAVLIDKDVATLYGVTTKEINQAVRNNPDKFPDDYIIYLTDNEKKEVVKNFDHLNTLKFSHAKTKSFTEKGLYMLATILKSPLATETTIAIIETFAKLRKLARDIQNANIKVANGNIPTENEKNKIQKMMTEVFNNNLPIRVQKMSFGINLGFFNFSAEIKLGEETKGKN